MSIIFISDLHLQENQSRINEIFFRFLKQITPTAQALYILGDFFEVWIGDDDVSPFNLSIIKALREATTKGLPIYLMRGNRDFLLGKRFARETGCQLLPDEHVIDIYGTPTLLMHGDTLCTQDIAYLKFRKKTRNWFIQKLILMKSLKKRRLIADNYRKASKEHIGTLSDNIMDVTQSEVERVMQKHHVQHLIHGHTHRQANHPFILNDKPATRTVLGAWHESGNALICEPGKSPYFVVLE